MARSGSAAERVKVAAGPCVERRPVAFGQSCGGFAGLAARMDCICILTTKVRRRRKLSREERM